MNDFIRSKRNLTKQPLEPGERIGDFEIIDAIGSGGFAVVYRAHQHRWDREVALKVLRPEATFKIRKLPQRFQREIDLARRLEHPNIVRLYDFGESPDGLLWMAMELVRGPELQEAIQRQGPFAPRRAKHVMLQILSGLAEAHSLQIVHRDLKPSNIMLTRKGAEDDVVKLLDFGVGKALGQHEDASIQDITTMSSGAYGTPRYMAPEHIRNETVSFHTDVYAAGLIFFELLTGRPAFPGSNTYEVLIQQLSNPLAFPDWLAGTPLAEVIGSATRKRWRQRFPDAHVFYDTLLHTSVDDLGKTDRDTHAPFPFDPIAFGSLNPPRGDDTRQSHLQADPHSALSAPALPRSSASLHALDAEHGDAPSRDTVREMRAFIPPTEVVQGDTRERAIRDSQLDGALEEAAAEARDARGYQPADTLVDPHFHAPPRPPAEPASRRGLLLAIILLLVAAIAAVLVYLLGVA